MVLTQQQKLRFSSTGQSEQNKRFDESEPHVVNGTNQSSDEDELNNRENFKRMKAESARNAKIIRLLVIVIAVFTVVWTPYIIIRIIVFSGIIINSFVYRGGQLLILSSTGVNFIIYSIVNPAFRKCFKDLLTTCLCRMQRQGRIHKKSDDVSDKTQSDAELRL